MRAFILVSLLSMSKLPRIAVLNKNKLDWNCCIDWAPLQQVASSSLAFYSSTTTNEILARSAGVNVLVTKEMEVSGDVIRSLDPSVKLIAEAGTGFNNIDLAAASERGIAVANVSDYSSQAVATLVMTAVLNASASIIPLHSLSRSSPDVAAAEKYPFPLVEVAGKRLGLVGGNGVIGRRVTALAQPFGLEVVVSSRSNNAAEGQKPIAFDELLATSDYVSLHCPLTEQTRHLISAKELTLMKPTAHLINTARGPIVDQTALIEALEGDVIAGAHLDVQEVEPLPANDPLWSTKNITITPHIGWKRQESRQRLVSLLAENIGSFFDPDRKSVNIVNEEMIR